MGWIPNPGSVRPPINADPEAFQSLSTRKRKNVTEQNTAVAVAHPGWVDLESCDVFSPGTDVKICLWRCIRCQKLVDLWCVNFWMLSKSGYVSDSGPKYVSSWCNCSLSQTIWRHMTSTNWYFDLDELRQLIQHDPTTIQHYANTMKVSILCGCNKDIKTYFSNQSLTFGSIQNACCCLLSAASRKLLTPDIHF